MGCMRVADILFYHNRGAAIPVAVPSVTRVLIVKGIVRLASLAQTYISVLKIIQLAVVVSAS